MNDRVVIIPTYNEKENIENILRYVFKLEPKFDVLVIEDNSPDGTAQIVKRLQSEFPQLHMIDVKESWDSARPISPDSNGHWNTGTITSSKWMPIFPIIPMI